MVVGRNQLSESRNPPLVSFDAKFEHLEPMVKMYE